MYLYLPAAAFTCLHGKTENTASKIFWWVETASPKLQRRNRWNCYFYWKEIRWKPAWRAKSSPDGKQIASLRRRRINWQRNRRRTVVNQSEMILNLTICGGVVAVRSSVCAINGSRTHARRPHAFLPVVAPAGLTRQAHSWREAFAASTARLYRPLDQRLPARPARPHRPCRPACCWCDWPGAELNSHTATPCQQCCVRQKAAIRNELSRYIRHRYWRWAIQ